MTQPDPDKQPEETLEQRALRHLNEEAKERINADALRQQGELLDAVATLIGLSPDYSTGSLLAALADMKSAADLAIKREIDNEMLRVQLLEMAKACSKPPVVVMEEPNTTLGNVAGALGCRPVQESMLQAIEKLKEERPIAVLDGVHVSDWRIAREILTSIAVNPNPAVAASRVSSQIGNLKDELEKTRVQIAGCNEAHRTLMKVAAMLYESIAEKNQVKQAEIGVEAMSALVNYYQCHKDGG